MPSATEVPVFTDLGEVYGQDEVKAASARYTKLRESFRERFHAQPDLFTRAPGRVNLIGEHIDYEGYGCLPMAIKQDTIVACRQHGDKLVLTNVNSSKYAEKVFELDPKQAVDTDNHSWANYFLAAYKGVFEFLGSKAPKPVGLEVMVSGVVPEGSGLSSSAAIVCSSALAVLTTLGQHASQTELATFTASCEKYVGTESGGMDQAISIMGQKGIAKLVEFNPVRAADVVLPVGATFVIANSLTVSAKAETAAGRYNMRVVEDRLAAILLALALGRPQAETAAGRYNMRVVEDRLAAILLALALGRSQGEAVKTRTLREVEGLAEQAVTGPKGSACSACCAAVEQHLHEEPYSEQELEGKVGMPLKQLFEGNASQLQVLKVAKGYKLRQRALHVYQEAARVPEFRDACNSSASRQETMAELARLMNDSQTSCRELYECSCPELDTLIRLSQEAGALAARLTGAGWGGCMVALAEDSKADAVIQHLKAQYFADFVKDGRLKESELDSVVFASRPASGGAILRLPA